MAPTAPESFLAYYRRVFARAIRDARTHVARNGVVPGVTVAIVSGFVQSRLDDTANFGSVAIAAIVAAILYSLVFFVSHLFRAPVALSNDERANIAKELQEAIVPKQDEITARDSEIARLRAEVSEYKTTLDHQAPKLALIEQLRKLDGIGGLALAAALRRSDEDREERMMKDVRAARGWEFETRQIIRNLIPQYERDFRKGPMLPLVGFPRNIPVKSPTIGKLQAWKAAKGDNLSEIIKQL